MMMLARIDSMAAARPWIGLAGRQGRRRLSTLSAVPEKLKAYERRLGKKNAVNLLREMDFAGEKTHWDEIMNRLLLVAAYGPNVNPAQCRLTHNVKQTISVRECNYALGDAFLDDFSEEWKELFAKVFVNAPANTQQRFLNSMVANSPRSLEFTLKLRRLLYTSKSVKSSRDKEAISRAKSATRHPLQYMYNPATTVLRPIKLDAPPETISTVLSGEKVHPVDSVDGLVGRMGSNRMCLGMFSTIFEVNRPLIFINVAFRPALSRTMRDIFESEGLPDDSEPRAAIFYSINACEPGLGGMDVGNALIMRGLDILQEKIPSITTFSTLSPVVGFKNWLDGAPSAAVDSIVPRKEIVRLQRTIDALSGGQTSTEESNELGSEVLQRSLEFPDWHKSEDLKEALRNPLLLLLSHYITKETFGSHGSGRADRRSPPRCPVAAFHLSNGASVYRLNWFADESKLDTSFGMMVNYKYDPATIPANSSNFANTIDPLPVDPHHLDQSTI